MIPFSNLSYWERSIYTEGIDFTIVGSGIVGLSTALHLRKANPKAKITILERGYLPTGASTKNAGLACSILPSIKSYIHYAIIDSFCSIHFTQL